MKNLVSLLLLSGLLAAVPVSAQFSLGGLADRAKEAAAEYDLPPDIVDQAKELASSFGLSKASLAKYANDALKALNGGEDLEALNLLSKIGNASLSDGQESAFKDLKVLVDTYVLSRNVEGEKGEGALGKSVEAIKGGDYMSAASQLTALISELKPTGTQLSILSMLKNQYSDWAESAAESGEE